MILETLFEGEPSCENPPIVTIPDIFYYNKRKVEIIRKAKYGFIYQFLGTKEEGYMSLQYFSKVYNKKI